MSISQAGPMDVSVVAADGALDEGGAQIPLRVGIIIIISDAFADVSERVRHVASPLRLPAKTENFRRERKVALSM